MLSGQWSIGASTKTSSAAEADPVAGPDRLEVPGLVIVARGCSFPALGDDKLAFGHPEHGRQRAGMVRLGVVGDDEVDLGRVNDLADVLHELVGNGPQTVSTSAIFSSTIR